MSKQDDLDKLDELVRKKMIQSLESNATEILQELMPVVNYLAKNNAVAEKAKSSIEEDIDKRLKEAKKRRAKT